MEYGVGYFMLVYKRLISAYARADAKIHYIQSPSNQKCVCGCGTFRLVGICLPSSHNAQYGWIVAMVYFDNVHECFSAWTCTSPIMDHPICFVVFNCILSFSSGSSIQKLWHKFFKELRMDRLTIIEVDCIQTKSG